MRIKLDRAVEYAPDASVSVLVYTYDPAEQALAAAMCLWLDENFDDAYTRHHNAERSGYALPAHCDGFDLECSSETMRKFLSSWRRYFDQHPDLDEVDKAVVR